MHPLMVMYTHSCLVCVPHGPHYSSKPFYFFIYSRVFFCDLDLSCVPWNPVPGVILGYIRLARPIPQCNSPTTVLISPYCACSLQWTVPSPRTERSESTAATRVQRLASNKERDCVCERACVRDCVSAHVAVCQRGKARRRMGLPTGNCNCYWESEGSCATGQKGGREGLSTVCTLGALFGSFYNS